MDADGTADGKPDGIGTADGKPDGIGTADGDLGSADISVYQQSKNRTADGVLFMQ
jgi:hypothetical protein